MPGAPMSIALQLRCNHRAPPSGSRLPYPCCRQRPPACHGASLASTTQAAVDFAAIMLPLAIILEDV